MGSHSPLCRSKLVYRNAQVGLFEGDPRDLVDQESLSAWLVKTIERLDFAPIHALFLDHGGFPYHPRVMLAIVLLGGFTRRTSSRDLEDCCKFDTRFIYVAGGQRPDYRTIARFRCRIAPVMEDLFKQVVRLAIDDGLVHLGRVSLDSTKVASAASRFPHEVRSSLNHDANEESSDPDAVVVRSRHAKFVRGYTVQAAVDADTGLVVAADVTQEQNDRQAAIPMLQRIEENTGFRPDELLCDAGYDSHETYQALDATGVTAYIPPQDKDRGFWSIPGQGRLLCPMGRQALPLKPKLQRGQWVDTYLVRGCHSCPLKAECCPKSRGRSVTAPVGASPVHRIAAMRRAYSPEGKLARVHRLSTIEPVFAHLKCIDGLERLTHRTLPKAKAQVLGSLMSRNLQRMYKMAQKAIFGTFWAVFEGKFQNFGPNWSDARVAA